MSKGTRIFLNVLYYILTFGIGIYLAASLPTALVYTYSMKDIQDSLNSKEYGKAMTSIGGYYDDDYVYLNDEENLVMFSTVTLIYKSEDEKIQDGTKIHKAYCGFFFNVKDAYKSAGEIEENKTKLVITNKDGEKINYNLLDYDYNQNGSVDSIATLLNYDFIFFEIPIEKASSISKLEFLDKEGTVFYNLEFAEPLAFSEKFFADVNPFVEEYNKDYKSAKLIELDEEFLSKETSYKKSSNSDVIKRVNGRTTLYVILYFVAIYLVGDSLIGFRFLPHGIRWLYRKVVKRKQKEIGKPSQKEITGNVFSNLTIELDVEEGFDKPVTVTYSNNNEQIEFYLLKIDKYKKTKRVQCGTYMNMKVIVDKDYEAIVENEVLELRRFNEKTIIKIRKKQGEEKWKLQFKI